jgi:hypothetical protein
VMKQNIPLHVLTAPTMKSTIFWDVTQCDPVEVHQRFGGLYCLHPQSRRYYKQAMSKNQSLHKYNLSSCGLHGAISQKIIFFKANTIYRFLDCTRLVVLWHKFENNRKH